MRKLSLKELKRVDVDTFRQQSKTPIVLVLDNIRSGLNVGSAFRTADAFALEKIYLCGITATPPHREILKTAIGATDSIDWESGELLPVLRKLKKEEYRLVAVEQTDASLALHDFAPPPDQPIAFIFGNEIKGVADEALDLADTALEVPQYGTKHSLNISVCLGIVVWEAFKKYKKYK